MHLLLAQKGNIQEGDEAVDLGQSPADLVFLSAADTDLASLSGARHALGTEAPELRLANLMQLSHPMSVDVYCENTVVGSRMIVARVLGGKAYWSYGLERLRNICARNSILLAVLPGDDKADPELAQFSNIGAEDLRRLHGYLCEGGPANAANFLLHCRHLLGECEVPADPAPLIKAGLWHPERGICSPAELAADWEPGKPVAALVFYRALVQSGGLAPIAAMVEALNTRGMNVLPLFVSSLKDPVSAETVRHVFGINPPSVVLNTTGFAVSSPGDRANGTVLDEPDCMVLQIVHSGGSKTAWQESSQGLSARDLAMNVALPEVDGRVLTRAVAFKQAENFDDEVQSNIVSHRPEPDRVEFVADLARNWARLGETPAGERRIGLVLANYPNRDGRIGNGVGLDTPAAALEVLSVLRESGYGVGQIPASGDALIELLQAGPTNAGLEGRTIRETLPLAEYERFFAGLSEPVRTEIAERWGDPRRDPLFDSDSDGIALPVWRCGNIAVAVQPARGYQVDPKQSYHSPDLVPPHGYLAFYAWLRREFDAHAVVHLGKHGNLEWLPGKALALSGDCYPEVALGPVPHLYPFIVNDPGEGSQAKRRSSAIIVDHLTPPLTRAESYGPLRELEALVDEYYEASGHDPRRIRLLGRQIFDLVTDIGLDEDAGIAGTDSEDDKLNKLDAWLCDLKEMQIRDGLHVFGRSPEGRLATDLAVALVRVPRGDGEGADQSLQRAIASDLALCFDPLDCDMAAPWEGSRPEELASISDDPWRTQGDTVERLELLAAALVRGDMQCPGEWKNTAQVAAHIRDEVMPTIAACGEAEITGLMRGLEGRFVAPGPSGAPTRGRLDVLPTGCNFYSVDSRAVPTPAAWELGRKSAELLITRYRQDNGEWPVSFGLSAWGTSNMRTGGDDIAQALALIGARPVWDHGSRRVTGYEIIPNAELGRPRVDVTLRISGFFRDAFPSQIELFDRAVRAIGELEETERDNPIAARMRRDREKLVEDGVEPERAAQQAGFRVFGSKPGAYGAGLQALIDEKGWEDSADLAEAYLEWGGYAYGAREAGEAARGSFEDRLRNVQAVIHNQDNREHDLLDSDDYYQFEGGMTAAVEHVSGSRPGVYHNDHSRPERPVIRALDEEIARVVRGRAANPKWIEGVMRHGYKGAFEMAATLDYLFAFAATTGAVRDRHFDLVHEAWIGNDEVREFLAEHNSHALREMAERFMEAIDRGMWTPRSNSAKFELEQLMAGSSGGFSP